MAKIVKTLNLLNEDYEFDAAKLGGLTPSNFVKAYSESRQEMDINGWLIEFGTKIEMVGYGQNSQIILQCDTNKVVVDNEHVNLVGDVQINGESYSGGGSSSSGLTYVGSGTCYDSSMFDFEDLDFITNSLNGHHVLIDWYLADKGAHLGSCVTYFSSGAYGTGNVFFATSVQMMGVSIFAGHMMTGPSSAFDGGFMIIDNEDLAYQISDFGLRGEFYLMD